LHVSIKRFSGVLRTRQGQALVRTSSESAVYCAFSKGGSDPASRAPALAGQFPTRRAAPPEPPAPSPQSQFLSQSYESILPTSLTLVITCTRGYSPWRPDAVYGTPKGGGKLVPRRFKGRGECTGLSRGKTTLPQRVPLLSLRDFHGAPPR